MLVYLFLFVTAYVYANLLEWVIHKYVFHGIGKNKKSLFASHWHTHHKLCRKNDNVDKTYENFPPHPTVKQEITSLIILLLSHTPIIFFSPFFFGSLAFFTVAYFYIHRKTHVDVEWGKRNFPWHYDHHMGKNQNTNWGVTSPLWDYIMGTRQKRLTSSKK